MTTPDKNPLKLSQISPQVQTGSALKSLVEERKRQDAEIKPQTILNHEDSGVSAHKPAAANAEFSDKVYLFPEAYNALRRELFEYWPNLFQAVGWNMAFKAEDFISDMNEALGMKLQFDSQKVEATCAAYLNELRRLRNLNGFTMPGQD